MSSMDLSMVGYFGSTFRGRGRESFGRVSPLPPREPEPPPRGGYVGGKMAEGPGLAETPGAGPATPLPMSQDPKPSYRDLDVGEQPGEQPTDDFAGHIRQAGLILQVGGALTAMVGSFYAVKSEQERMKAEASSLEFQKTMAGIDAQNAERDAQAVLEAGRQQIGQLGMRYAQERAARRVRTGAAGVQMGVGSAAEVATSDRYAQAVDSLTINRNAVRAASQARLRGVSSRNRAELAGVSARNLRRTAGTLNPYVAATTSLLNSAGSVAQQWLAAERWDSYRRTTY